LRSSAGIKFLIGAVARVMRPGCKMDNVLILEGEQGRWKSTALATLAGDWFGDTPFTIGDKDAYLVIRGSLIYELAELDGFSRAESSRSKAFFSSRYDTFVPKYVALGDQGAAPVRVRRHGEPRHLPARHHRQPALLAGEDRARTIAELERDRDQLWAEAVREQQGVRWWVEEEERELFALEQELRYVGDAYEDEIRSWALDKKEFTMAQVLATASSSRSVEVDARRADARRRGAGDPRLREEGPRLEQHAALRLRAARAATGRGGLMRASRIRAETCGALRTLSAPTPHPVRSKQRLGAASENTRLRTSAPRAHVCAAGAHARRAHTWLSGAEGTEGTEYGSGSGEGSTNDRTGA
jgi:hypothetical protein